MNHADIGHGRAMEAGALDFVCRRVDDADDKERSHPVSLTFAFESVTDVIDEAKDGFMQAEKAEFATGDVEVRGDTPRSDSVQCRACLRPCPL